MTASRKQTAPEAARHVDPREVLSPAKQTQIVVLLRLGYSRRMAARHVGCSHTTIGRAADRDPFFASQMAFAQSHVDLDALRQVRNAATQDKYWRAAAWLLERRNPEEFGHRTPHSFSGDQVMALLAQVFSYALPALREDQKEQFTQSFNGTLQEVEAAVAKGDRWRNLADDPKGRKSDVLRSPYEHPEWHDPAAVAAGEETASTGSQAECQYSEATAEAPAQPELIDPILAGIVQRAAAINARRLAREAEAEAEAEADQTLDEEAAAEADGSDLPASDSELVGDDEPAPLDVEVAAVAATGAKADVCQSSPEWRRQQRKLRRRKWMAANGLRPAFGSVPHAENLRGGAQNGHQPALVGNGQS